MYVHVVIYIFFNYIDYNYARIHWLNKFRIQDALLISDCQLPMIDGAESFFFPTHTKVVPPRDNANFSSITLPQSGPLVLMAPESVRLTRFMIRITQPVSSSDPLNLNVTFFNGAEQKEVCSCYQFRANYERAEYLAIF